MGFESPPILYVIMTEVILIENNLKKDLTHICFYVYIQVRNEREKEMI